MSKIRLKKIKQIKRRMSPAQLANLRPVKKGEIRNPLGCHAQNPHLKALKKLNVEVYCQVIELVLTNDIPALKAMAESLTLSSIQVAIAKVFLKAISNSDYALIERITERIFGKIPDMVNIKTDNNSKTIVIGAEAFKDAAKKFEDSY